MELGLAPPVLGHQGIIPGIPPPFAGHHLDHRQEEQQTHLQGEPGGDGEQDSGGFSPLQGVWGGQGGEGPHKVGAGWG